MVVQDLVDELVWHYPAIVLAGKGNRSADMALRLAGVVARILELAPTYRGLASSPFRGTERRFDGAFIQKHARLCVELLDREPPDPLHQETSARVHAAMRTIIVAGGDRYYQPDDDSLIWGWRFRSDNTVNPQSVLQYLERCRQEEDIVGLGDALLVTTDMWCLGSNVQKAAFLDILISSLAAESTRLRHIAIQVAWENRVALSATENTQRAETGEKLLTTFSQALMTSISLDIASANGASDRADNDQDPANDKPNDNSDLRFHDLRDWCYLELIFTLANSSDCIPSIVKDGHLDRCLLLLQRDILHPYVSVIFLRIEAENRVDSARLSEITEEQWQEMTFFTWHHLSHLDLKDCIDILSALAERTIKYLSSDSRDLHSLREIVVEVLDQLTKEGVREEIQSAVGTLVKAIDERQR